MLKKSAIALAVAAAIAAPMAQAADATIYGRVEAALTSEKDKDLAIEEYSRLGVKGSADLNNGMKAGYKLEMAIDDDPTVYNESYGTSRIRMRQTNVSLSGGFGTVTVGRQTNPYSATYVADQFENYTGDLEQAPFRYGNAVIWQSSDMGGMDFYAGAAMDENQFAGDAGADMDAIVFGFNGNFSGVGVHAGIITVDEEGAVAFEETLTSVGVDYTMGKIYLAGNFETAKEGEETGIELAALYDLSGTTKVGVGMSSCDDDAVGTGNDKCGGAEETRLTAGGYFDMGNGVGSWLEYGSKDEADTNYIQAGMRVKF